MKKYGKVRMAYRFSSFLLLIKQNKIVLYLWLGGMALGFVCALRGIDTAIENNDYTAFATAIEEGGFPILSPVFHILLLPCCFVGILLLFAVNFYLLWAFLLFLPIVFSVLFKYCILIVCNHIVTGLATVLLLILPITTIDFFIFLLLWIHIYQRIGYPCKKRVFRVLPFSCYFPSVKKAVKNALLSLLFINAALFVFASVLFSVVF